MVKIDMDVGLYKNLKFRGMKVDWQILHGLLVEVEVIESVYAVGLSDSMSHRIRGSSMSIIEKMLSSGRSRLSE